MEQLNRERRRSAHPGRRWSDVVGEYTHDVEIVALKAETNRLILEGLLVLGQLETHEEHLTQFITETRTSGGNRKV